KIAISIIRRHRLWEVFLVNNLGFGWDEVHDIAEQLEHIQSEDLVNRLDKYLGHPNADPHGDPIPNVNGEFAKSKAIPLSNLPVGKQAKFSGVIDHSSSFLSYLNKIEFALGDPIRVKSIEEYDNSYTLQLKNEREIVVSSKFVNSILVIEG
ncbi:MAG TPA: metal-dependent transcriptional regulator, partial [Daejeonella sp.]|nr:metal-dependent transcriptional regulator [Daejeonella sp.]